MTILTLILTMQDPYDTYHEPVGDHRGKLPGEAPKEITWGKSPGGSPASIDAI